VQKCTKGITETPTAYRFKLPLYTTPGVKAAEHDLDVDRFGVSSQNYFTQEYLIHAVYSAAIPMMLGNAFDQGDLIPLRRKVSVSPKQKIFLNTD
jgi:hypothetical protein